MSQILITWPEFQALDFPKVCFACGARATRVDSWKFSVVSHQFLATVTKYHTVEVPVCPDHWNHRRLGGVKATRFTDDGIWFKNVSPDFIEALWDHREDMDRTERRLRREMEERGEAERESRVDRWGRRLAPPRPRPRRGDRRFEKPASNTGVVLLIVFGALVAVMLVGCLGLLIFGNVTRQPVNPGFNNPGFNDPPPGIPFPRRRL
ncbi:MAG: hypothetical protein FJ271_16780 [Planctomycetes bacterium]|nr:hypothetical protein [Planctomycetota bacterium]